MGSKKNGEDKIIAGGSATGGGINFQAAVTALVEVHIAIGIKLGWLTGVASDIPVNVSAETGGPGDDIGIQFADGASCEVQVKRGFTAGKKLWETIMKLSKAVNDDVVNYGVLVVCPNSSGTIKNEFARDLERIGGGRLDGLKPIAIEFIKRLQKDGLSVEKVAKSLRIITLSCLVHDSDAIRAAKAWLGTICDRTEDVDHAWNSLYLDGGRLIEYRGARAADTVTQLLRSEGILFKAKSQAPSSLLDSLCLWTINTTAFFTIPGIAQPIPIAKGWLELDALVISKGTEQPSGLAEALEYYHAKAQAEHRHYDDIVPAGSLGRFVRRCVLIGGPGMGKSTSLKKLAQDYALEGFPVIRFAAKSVAHRMRYTGCSFEEGILALGMDGSGLSILPETLKAGSQWVVLCDALDEAINDQELICEGLLRFSAGYPQSRIIVTTRPIGYNSNLLRDWRHYEIQSLKSSLVMHHIEDILRIVTQDVSKQEDIVLFARGQIDSNENVKVASRSPLILALVAALAEKKVPLGDTKTQLYERLFNQMEKARGNQSADESSSSFLLTKYLDTLAWHILLNPTAKVIELHDKCGHYLAQALAEPTLKASVLAEKCLIHWERVGMVERVNHAGVEAITFIHKTFGEYAAARYLSSIDKQLAYKEIQGNINTKNWSEVLIFASSLGLADSVLQCHLEANANLTYIQVGEALSMMADSEMPPSLYLREKVYQAANIYLRSPIPREAVSIGNKIIDLGVKFPQEVAKLGFSLLDSEQPWTRLAGLAAITFYPPHYDSIAIKKLASELPELSENVPWKSKQHNGLDLGASPNQQIDTVCIYIVKEILKHFPSEQADALLVPLITSRVNRTTLNGLEKLTSVMRDYGKPNFIELLESPFKSWKNIGASFQSPLIALDTFVDALTLQFPYSDTVPDLKENDKLWSLSGFMSATAIWKQPIGDIWTVQTSSENRAISEVLLGIVIASGVDSLQLSIDLARIKIKFASKEKSSTEILHRYTQDVDIEMDWSRTKGGVDAKMLEAALHNSATWIIEAAANLIAVNSTPETLAQLVFRVFKSGEDYALWAASELCLLLDEPKKSELIINRLKEPLRFGCQHLYSALVRLDLTVSEQLLEVLKTGLLTYGPLTAMAAADVAGKYALENPKLIKLLQESFDLWCTKEEPSPTKSGVVPESPRAKILELLIKSDDFPNSRLLKYVSDVRSDVSKVASDRLFCVLQTGALCDEFLTEISSGKIPPKFLHTALNKNIVFTKSQIDKISAFLSQPRAELRQAAILILRSNYLAEPEINKLATLLLSDVDPEIREQARRLLVPTQEARPVISHN